MRLATRMAVPATMLALCGCGGLPDRVDSVEQARQSINDVSSERLAGQVAAEELAQAREALASADAAFEEKEPLPLIEHRAYVAQRYADISRALVAEAQARAEVEGSEAERSQLIAEAREREAAAAEREALATTRQLDVATRELDVQEGVAAEQARATQAAEERASRLERELEELEAENTDRGIVLTLGDVLFDTGEAGLKPGATTTIDRLAQFMRDYPERSVRIEGHTDSVGSDDTNQALSERRATAVRDALVGRGIAAERVATVGVGEARPVASNDTLAGRQQNRRVEVIVSDDAGSFGDSDRRAGR